MMKSHKKVALIAVFIAPLLPTFAQEKKVVYQPTSYYRNFSHKAIPALKIQQGDTVVSESVDAGGFDKTGKCVTERGNPLTGPFYIEGASAGDVLAVNLITVELNRDYATTVETFVQRSLSKEISKPVFAHNAKLVRWTLKKDEGFATPQKPHEHLANFRIPLQPFIGCLGVAAPKNEEPLSFFAGQFGGNMDFYKVRQGATIYLPVFHDGALLYIGDGHAAQGDGEITGDALETSMNFAFVTKVIKASELSLSFPRLEDAQHIVALATDKTLEGAIQKATLNLLQWLQKDYNLSLSEASQVIGTSVEYKIPTLAGPTVEIAAMLKKEILSTLKK